MRANNFFLFLSLPLILASCQQKQVYQAPAPPPSIARPTEPTTPPPVETPWSVPTMKEEAPPAPPPNMNAGVTPKIGLILGPGALRAYAHVGFVQEFVKAKLQIQSIVGIESGALVAAIYANKGTPFDVEWQMMKLKESDWFEKGFLSREIQPGDAGKGFGPFLTGVFNGQTVSNAKISFGCPAFQMAKKQIFMMNRGTFQQILPYCLAFPPLYKPYQQNVAGVFELKSAVDFVRSKGANYVIYVDLLSGPLKLSNMDIATQVLWNLADQNLQRQERGLDEVIHVPLQEFDLFDFSKRRELLQKGQQIGQQEATRIMTKLGL